MVLAQLPAAQAWTVPLPVPALPGIVGVEFAFQAIHGPTVGVLGFDLSNGVRWQIGF